MSVSRETEEDEKGEEKEEPGTSIVVFLDELKFW